MTNPPIQKRRLNTFFHPDIFNDIKLIAEFTKSSFAKASMAVVNTGIITLLNEIAEVNANRNTPTKPTASKESK